ncbi:MAG: hypothetical protein BGP06_05285 [Rhizobiales bacterium 65-9]|nr:hypothetical protein [Hyphomicrobiales bacterium]OJY35303.1 MAG: hypothetical protein BGP06_05285 [Rhizobiales bacterium 65-9]
MSAALAPTQIRRPVARRLGVSQRRRIEDAIDRLIAVLDALDAPGEDLEPEPVGDDGFGDCEVESWG